MKSKRKHGGELTKSFGDDPKTKLEFKPDPRRPTYADEQSTRNKKKKNMRVGGLTGNQTKMDMNKNNKIDSEDFKMLRNKKSMAKGGAIKMAKGGAIKPKMAKGGSVKMAKGGSVKMAGGGMMAKGYSIGGAIDAIEKKKTKMAKGGAKGGTKMAKANGKRKRDGMALRGRTRA